MLVPRSSSRIAIDKVAKASFLTSWVHIARYEVREKRTAEVR